jgi:hypothetical protein
MNILSLPPTQESSATTNTKNRQPLGRTPTHCYYSLHFKSLQLHLRGTQHQDRAAHLNGLRAAADDTYSSTCDRCTGKKVRSRRRIALNKDRPWRFVGLPPWNVHLLHAVQAVDHDTKPLHEFDRHVDVRLGDKLVLDRDCDTLQPLRLRIGTVGAVLGWQGVQVDLIFNV